MGKMHVLVGCICDTLKVKQSNSDPDWHDPRFSFRTEVNPQARVGCVPERSPVPRRSFTRCTCDVLKAISQPYAADQPTQQPRSSIRRRFSAEGLHPRSGAPSLLRSTDALPAFERKRLRQSMPVVFLDIANSLPIVGLYLISKFNNSLLQDPVLREIVESLVRLSAL